MTRTSRPAGGGRPGTLELNEALPRGLTAGRLLAGNVVWNLAGQGLPMLAALFTIPLLVQGMGTERFGVLTLAWALIGYFSLFDLGLGRALTQLLSEMLGAGQERDRPALIWTSLFLMFLFGLAGTVVLGLLSPLLVHRTLKIPPALQAETLAAFRLLAVSIPLIISNAGLVGILSAFQRFGLINAVRVPMGLFTFLGPLVTLQFSNRLSTIVLVLVVGRLIAWLVHLQLCLRVIPALRHNVRLVLSAMKRLLRFGGWLTVTNLVGPLMTYLDRFLIGAALSTAAVAYYATPYEVVTRLWIIPAAVVGVLFPAFTVSFLQDRKRAELLFERGTRYIFLAMFPITLLVIAFASDGLRLWLGADFAAQSTPVLRWLALGIFVNSLGQIPFVFAQSVGRPDLSAKLHAIELPFYLAAVWWLIHAYGIRGAAIGWAVRAALDAAALFAIAGRFLSTPASAVRRGILALATALLLLGVASFRMALPVKASFLALALAGSAALLWVSFRSDRNRSPGMRTAP